MPESSDKPSSRKKKDQQLPSQDQQHEASEPVGGEDMPETSEPKLGGVDDFSAEKTENTEEFPSWLFELESKAVNSPVENIRQASDPREALSSSGGVSEQAGDEAMHEDLPDWLKQETVLKPPVKQQSVPEDELPDWLKYGAEEDAQLKNKTDDSDLLEDVTSGEDEQSHPSLSETDDTLIEEPQAATPEAPDSEPLAEVRLALKDAEQSKAQDDRSGLLTKMTGWFLASSQIKRDASDQPSEDAPGAGEVEPKAPETEDVLADVPPDISTELMSSRSIDYDRDNLEDDDAVRKLESSIFLDDFDESLAKESEADYESSAGSEIGAETAGGDQPIDEDLRREILSDIESSSQDQISQSVEEDKGSKGFLKGLFGSKKGDDSQDPSISDQEIERRLLLGLTASGLVESQSEESSLTDLEESTGELEPGALFFQDEAGYLSQPDLLDEALSPEEAETFYSLDYDESDDQQVGEESLPEESIDEDEVGGVAAEVSYTELREIALHDYVETPQQPEGSPVSLFIQKVLHQIEELSPLQKISLAVLFIVDIGFMIFLAAIFTFSNFTAAVVPPTPPPAPTARISGPFPSQVILPGGWSFNLTPVTLREGLWANQGAEWLQGSEITRWVALPWSKQLEAVVVTFGPDEQIELVMSNLDRVKYKVESVQEVPVEKVRDLNRNTPSLLLILANKDSDSRIVVTGSLVTDE